MVGPHLYVVQPSRPADASQPWRAVASSCCILDTATFRTGAIAPAPPRPYADIQFGDNRLSWDEEKPGY
ncbi:MAG: hypothetical protein K2P95_04515, partial [Hyphomonadaceae bacterium]|nr:hypothetical protein [Hyphomonadaceae bacterium]